MYTIFFRLTCYRFGAADTFLSIQVAEALQTVGVVLSGGEALPCQLFLTANASKTFAVPWLIIVGHPASSDGLQKTEKKLGFF